MQNFICVQCGTQFDDAAEPSSRCPISQEERQYVRHTGQEWTMLKRLTANHYNRIEDEAPQLLGIGTEPEFAIGQRALLLQSPGGNLLWDCISLLDDETIAEMVKRGTVWVPTIDHNRYYVDATEEFGWSRDVIPPLEGYIEKNLESTKRAFKAGVKLAMGSDAVYTMFGQNTRELAWFVKAGMTPAQALATATTIPAKRGGDLRPPRAPLGAARLHRRPRARSRAGNRASALRAGRWTRCGRA